MRQTSINFFSDRISKGFQQMCAIVAVDGATEEDDRMKNGKEYENAGLCHAISYVIALTMVISYQVSIVEHLRSRERVSPFAVYGTKKRSQGKKSGCCSKMSLFSYRLARREFEGIGQVI